MLSAMQHTAVASRFTNGSPGRADNLPPQKMSEQGVWKFRCGARLVGTSAFFVPARRRVARGVKLRDAVAVAQLRRPPEFDLVPS
jgi:hypothetical protein